jgi:transmembrane 9 superfamily protein 2/4
MLQNSSCKVLCHSVLPSSDAQFVNQRIEEKYLFNWMVDGLPAAQKTDTGMEYATPGFFLGQMIHRKGRKVFVL